MAERPWGTVTFLFTDVEGSTTLLKGLGERYGAVLGEHQRILRESFTAHGGEEVDTQGDSFFFVFSRARDAVAAAVEGQRRLAGHEWPAGHEFRVRMGLHTGEPVVSPEGRYHGLGVHRAARIAAAAHGGQVLASGTTISLLGDDAVTGIELRDLGEHRLKDLDRPERLTQLSVEGLRQSFPPPRTGVDAPRRPWDRAYWTRRRRLAGVAVIGAALPAAALAVLLGRPEAGRASVDANAVGFISARSGTITDEVVVGATPTHVAVGEGAAWVVNTDDDTVSRVDPRTRAVIDTIEVGNSPSEVTVASGSVWVTNSLERTVSRIDPATGTEVQKIPVGNGPSGIVSGAGSIWVANTGDDTITRIDAASGEPRRTLDIPATGLAFGAGTLWASQRLVNRVVRIEPGSGTVIDAIPVGSGPVGLAFGHDALWVANSLDGTVSRVDPGTSAVVAIRTGNGPSDVAADEDAVWVSNQFDGTLARIDPGTNDVVRLTSVGNRPQGVATLDGDVLVAVRESGAGHRGGTLTVRMNRGTASFDTAYAYDSVSWTILRMTNDGLVAFNQASGLEGTQLVPDLALAIPRPTNDGKSYTFTLRPDVLYSDGRPVRASDFRFTFERLFSLTAPTQPYYSGIVGVERCIAAPKRCDLSRGIVTNDAARTVTFRLVEPDPEFLYALALPFAFVVPPGTPANENRRRAQPATGPYMLTSLDPKARIELERNPHFREWSKAAQPDGYPDTIVFEVGGTPDSSVKAVVDGRADVFSTSQSQTPPSESLMSSIRARFASQVHTNIQLATIYLFLNTRIPPFDSLDARRALNLAADRAAAVVAAGGQSVGQPTCQVLPPSIPGYAPYCPYTTGVATDGKWMAPDLARARALVERSGTKGMEVTFWSWGDLGGIGAYAVELLRSLGYRASLTEIEGFDYFTKVADSRTRAQIGAGEWIADYPSAAGFHAAVLTCASFLPESAYNSNLAQFCDPSIDRQVERAVAIGLTDPAAARTLWQQIDRDTTDRAPWVSLVNPRVVDVLAKRVGNYQYSPAWGLLLSQLWVQ